MDGNGAGRSERAAIAALAITAALAATKLAVALATSSLAILSQALDSFLDLVALALVLFAVRIAAKPADSSHHYGHSKAENLAAFAQTNFLIVVVAGVVIEAVRRLSVGGDTGTKAPWYSFALLGASVVVDAVRAFFLVRAARSERSEALRAGALNVVTDLGTAVVAIGSLVLISRGVHDADAIGALIVAAAVAVAAYRLGKRSVDVLMDRAPSTSTEAIQEAAARAPGVAETRRVRVRGTGDQLFADVTVAAGRTTSLERAHEIAESVEREIAQVAPGADVVVHVEPASETTGLVERVQAAASRVPGVHEVHNVLVHAFDEEGRQKLHVTLHAKAVPSSSLEEAHSLSDAIEAEVEKELEAEVRVDTHIEPLLQTSAGRDVTAARQDLVDNVRALAVEEPDVLDCHEVLITDVGGELAIVAHVRGRGDLALARIHAASERIEKSIHSTHPEVGAVVIHFEPA
jgi:cation diffusion facilitator family transporter